LALGHWAGASPCADADPINISIAAAVSTKSLAIAKTSLNRVA
jgi:hypothetical protein